MSSEWLEILLAAVGIGFGTGAAYGFVSAVMAEIASRLKERQQK